MNLKPALILLLVFASTVTATAIAFSAPVPISLNAFGGTIATCGSYVQPLGDPIDNPGPPHLE